MSNCLINRNTEGRIISVTTPEGKPSELFNEVHTHYLAGDSEISAQIVSAIYNKDILDLFKGATKNVYASNEPKLFYQTSQGNTYDNMDDVLINGEVGEITLGFKNPQTDEFIPTHVINTNSSAKSKFLTSVAQEGIISSERVLGEDGITRHKGQGLYDTTSRANARAAQMEAMFRLGSGSTKVNADGTLEFAIEDDYVTSLETGETIRIEDIPTSKDSTAEMLVLHNQMTADPIVLGKGQTTTNEEVQNRALLQQLKNFLGNMGFTLSTLESYQKNYQTRYGQDADITAIADLANKVVAISEGANITDELLEEVAHIAIEAYADQNSIASMLVNVEFTPEYEQFAARYKEKYAKFISEENLEDHVRREILGKVLARTIKENFNAENKTPEQTSLLEKLRDLWNRFTNFLSGKATPYQKGILKELNDKIATAVLRQNMAEFTDKLVSDKFFYDLSDETSLGISNNLKVAKESLQNIFNQIIKQPIPITTQLEKVMDGMTELEILDTINALQGTTKTQLNRVKQSFKEAKRKGTPVPDTDIKLIQSIVNQIVPVLEGLKRDLKKTKEFSQENVATKLRIMAEISNVATLAREVAPMLDEHQRERVEQILEDTTKGKTAEEKEAIESFAKTAIADVSSLGAMVGLVSKSKNIFINLMGKRAAQMSFNVAYKAKAKIDEYLRQIQDLTRYEKQIVRTVDGKMSSYYKGFIREDLREQAAQNIKIEEAVKLTDKTAEEIKRLSENKVSWKTILGSDTLLEQWSSATKPRLDQLKERPRNDKYYEEREAQLLEANVSDDTQSRMRDISAERAILYSRPGLRDKSGKIDRSKMNAADLQHEADLKQRYEFMKNPYDQDGELKLGLKITANADLTADQKANLPEGYKGYLLEITDDLENLDPESRVAFDMYNLNLSYMKQRIGKQQELSSAFSDKVDEMEAANQFNELYDWATMNATFSLNDAFYSLSDDSKSYFKQAEEWLDSEVDPANEYYAATSLKEIKDLQLAKSNLLKQHRDKNNPTQINAYDMHSNVKAKLVEIESKIQANKKLLRDLGFEYKFEEAKGPKTLKSTNEAYTKDLKESGYEGDEVTFAKKHMTKENTDRFDDFVSDLRSMTTFRKKSLKKSNEAFVKRALEAGKLDSQTYFKFKGLFDNLAQQKAKDPAAMAAYDQAAAEVTRELSKIFARDLVASYYQQYEIDGYQDLVTSLKAGEVKFSDIINDKETAIENLRAEGKDRQADALQYLDFNPDYTWLEEVDKEDSVNKNFNPDGVYSQAKVKDFLDNEFFEEFGIDKAAWLENPEWDLSKVTATRNKEAFKLLQLTVAMRKDVIEMYGNTSSTSPYLRPQIHKKLDESFLSGSIKNFAKEISKSRIDDQDYGAVVDTVNAIDLGVKFVPKFFQSKIEEGSGMLTQNVISAAMLDVQQAILYQERVAAEQDFKSLELAVKEQEFTKAGLIGTKVNKRSKDETSNYYKMAKEYVDHKLYGVKQVRNMQVAIGSETFDMTKIIHSVQSVFRYSNLAYNPFVDAVSFTTGIFNNAMDRYVQDYYSRSSANRGMKETLKMTKDFFSESGKIEKKGKMNHLLEFLGVQDITSRLSNSAYNRSLRFLLDSEYKMSKAANIPVAGHIVNTLLCDHRFVEGRFRNWEEFVAFKRGQQKDIPQVTIEAEWKKYENDSMFDNISITDKGVAYNDKFAAKFGENTEEEFLRISSDLSAKARIVAQNADGTLNENDQIAAQRDILTSVLMTHRGWLPILLSRKFSKRHYNAQVGRFEEGQLRTVGRLARNLMTSRRNGQTFAEVFKNMDPMETKNAKRVAGEVAALIGMLFAGAMFFGDDDDDDASYPYHIANYVFTRTVSEVATQTPFGITGAVVEVMKNPLTSIRMIEALEPVELASDIFTLDYKSLGNKLVKQTILKRIPQITDIEEKLASYKHFNKGTLFTMSPENVRDWQDSGAAELIGGGEFGGAGSGGEY